MMNRVSENPRVPMVEQREANLGGPGVCPLFFISGFLSISFRLQGMATLKEGDQWQMWEFIRI